ncbi:hypothetical protein GQ457_03G046860 [Hibiscus cannabinus]
MEVTGETPPLWPPLTTSTPRRRPPSPVFSLPVLIILLPIFTLLLLFLAVPPFLSVTAEILSHLSVRKSWDSLNVFLVLFAIIFGVLARRNDGDETGNNNGNDVKNDSVSDSSKASDHQVSQQWFEHPERKIYDGSAPIKVRRSPETSVRRLKRSSSSYPDMRQDSLWMNNEDRFRFFDDFEINNYRSSTNYDVQVHELRRTWRSGFQESEAKVIPVDTFVLCSSPSPPLSTALPPPPPPPAARNKPRRTYHKGMNKNDRVEINETKSPSVTPPPPPPRRPPSPLIQVGNRSEQKHGKSERRKSTATKEIKMVFASLRKRKKKHKAQDHGHQQDCPLHSPTEPPPNNSTTIRPSSPAPPPPPPPSSVFQKYNLFRKSSKNKTIHSVPTPPPPPPPAAFSFSKRSSKQNTQIIPPTPPPEPPPATFYKTRILSKQKSQIPPPPEPSRKRTTSNNGRPPLPTKANTSSYYDDNVNSGEQSPLIPMPPPPPPFKMPDFKLVIRGDFVKIRGSPSSPDMEEIDVSSSKDEAETAGSLKDEVASVPVYCRSPDVNAKAETFIARLRDEWKLEKINSMKEKQII